MGNCFQLHWVRAIKAIKGGKAYTKENTIITADEFYYDKIKKILIATGQVEVIDELNNLTVNAPKIFYYKDKEIIVTEGKTISLISEKYLLNSKNITVNRVKSEIKSDDKTDVNDGLGNLIYLDNFKYYISKQLLKQIWSRFRDLKLLRKGPKMELLFEPLLE